MFEKTTQETYTHFSYVLNLAIFLWIFHNSGMPNAIGVIFIAIHGEFCWSLS
jgi:hypothetical protein